MSDDLTKLRDLLHFEACDETTWPCWCGEATAAIGRLSLVERAALVGIELTEEESAEKYATIPAEELHTSHGGLNYQPRTRFVTSWRSSGDPS